MEMTGRGRKPTKQPHRRLRAALDRLRSAPSLGVVLGVMASFFLSVAFMLAKFVKGVDPVFFVSCRGFLQVSFFNAVAFYQGPPLNTLKSRSTCAYLILAGVLVSAGQALIYWSLEYIPISDATAINSSSPIFVSIFAFILLKEKCGVFQVFTQMVAISGVVLICRPTFIFGSTGDHVLSQADHIRGGCLITAGCVSLSGLYVTLRKLIHVPTAITNSACGLVTVLFGLAIMGAKGNWVLPECGLESVLLVFSACAGTIGMLLLVCATRVEEAGPLSVVRTSEIIFAFLWQTFLFRQPPPWSTVLGAALIASTVAIIGTRNWTSRRLTTLFGLCCTAGQTSPEEARSSIEASPEQLPLTLFSEHRGKEPSHEE